MRKMRIARRSGVLACAIGVVLVVPATAQAAGNWAVVSSTGTLARGSQVASTSQIGTGRYEVIFTTDVTKCAYIAIPGTTSDGTVSGSIAATVARREGNPRGVFIELTNTATGTATDDPFHLTVYCGKTARFAVVHHDGKLNRGKHVSSVKKLGKGHYQVLFDSKVSKCAYTATIGDPKDGVAKPGELTVTGRKGKSNGVVVRTFNTAGAATDRSFYLAVTCGNNIRWAVIKSNATKARGPHVTSVSPDGTGAFDVVFDRDVTDCAYTATVGKPGSTTIAEAVTVTTAQDSGVPDGVFIYIHKFDGTAMNEPFHLRVAC